ncbi:MAG: T9SS type A sorting domain-containing protein [Prolixibacteraceae bacterium]|nr:T9SS type A sorting domain-containing protein [Prolixibacteraceae bacterium]
MKKTFNFLLLIIISVILPAQTNFTKYNSTGGPVLYKGADTTFTDSPRWDFLLASDANVVFYQDTFRLWYTSSSNPEGSQPYPGIGYAWSVDGINWTKFQENTPVFKVKPGAWDSLSVETVSVLIDSAADASERYKMWYLGEDDVTSVDDNKYFSIGYAWSADGISWTRYPNPVLEADTSDWSIDYGSIEGPSVIKDGDTLRMYYAGFSAMFNSKPWDMHFNILYAWSIDGINWHKKTDEPVLAVNSDNVWEDVFVQDPKVLKIGETYHMWYGALGSVQPGQQIGYAVSTNGIHWVRNLSQPILPTGKGNAWDNYLCSFPAVVYKNDVFHLWYTGADERFFEPTFPYSYDIGYAYDSSVVTSTSDKKRIEIENVNVYPNPVCETLFIKFDPLYYNKKTRVVIRNAVGQLVYDFCISPSCNSLQISTQSWQKGMYIITWMNHNQVASKIIVKL